MHYTQRIRGLREDMDLRQKDIADLLNVGQKTYSDYELARPEYLWTALLCL